MTTPETKIETTSESPAPAPKAPLWTPERLLWGLGVLGLLIGGYGLYLHFTEGLRVTALGSFVPWGLGVAMYVYFVWLEVGTVLLFTVLVYVLKWNTLLPGMARMVYLAALAFLTMALIMIGMDLGHPFRFWHVLAYPQWNSLITWMFWLHVVYMALLLIKLFLEWRPVPARWAWLGTWLSYLGLPLGIALIVVVGGVFGVVIGRPAWQGSALPIYFLLSAMVAGAGLLTFEFVWFWPQRQGTDYVTTARRLGNLLLGLLIVALISTILIGTTILYPGVPAQATALQLTLFGPYWWVFWIFFGVFGVLVPIIALITQSQNARRIGLAAGLVVLTFIAVPLNIVIPPQLVIEVVEKGLVTAYTGPGLLPTYFPTWSEWLLALFALSLGFLIFMFGYHILQLRPQAKVTEGQ